MHSFRLIAPAMLFLSTLPDLAIAGSQTLENGYIRLRLSPDHRVAVAWDPAGRGSYPEAPSWLSPWGAAAAGKIELADNAVRATGDTYVNLEVATGGFPGPFDHGEDLPTGGTLGQTFTLHRGEGLVQSVWAFLTGEGRPDSAATLVLHRDGPDGPVLAQRRVVPVPENEQVPLVLPEPVAPGTFYLEISRKQGSVYWWSSRRDAWPNGMALLDRKPAAGDRCFGYHLADRGIVDWSAELKGPRLDCRLVVRNQERKGYRPALAIAFPWQRDGYDTSDRRWTPFDYLFTDSGSFLPVEAFKRLSRDWALDKQAQSTRLAGTGGFDLRLGHSQRQLVTRMDSDRIHFLLANGDSVEVLPHADKAPADLPVFLVSDDSLAQQLNRFLWTFSTDVSSTPCTFAYDALKLCWTGGPVRDQFQRILLHFTHRIDDDGYVWSRGESRGWDGSDCSAHDGRLYDGNAPFIVACGLLFDWSGDRGFLDSALPAVRKAVGYLLDKLHGREGLLTLDSPEHSGVPATSLPGSYFDCIPAGYRDAYINVMFVPALEAAASLERAAGDVTRASQLESTAALARRQFNDTFWSESAGRYISWIDRQGTRHDCGMTYVNTMAATHGLASAEKVARIFRWMTTEPTAAGTPDTFSRWIFAPRSNTIHCHQQRNKYPFDQWCEDGGAILWTAYYEILARARFLGADNAWQRFRQILDRYAMPDHLVGGNPLYRGEINNHNQERGSVGIFGEFPESGLAPCAFLYAFLEPRVEPGGLRLHPKIPASLSFVGVDRLRYHGQQLKITAYRDHVQLQTNSRSTPLEYDGSGTVLITPDTLNPP